MALKGKGPPVSAGQAGRPSALFLHCASGCRSPTSLALVALPCTGHRSGLLVVQFLTGVIIDAERRDTMGIPGDGWGRALCV